MGKVALMYNRINKMKKRLFLTEVNDVIEAS